ncbi:hypothetical protein NWP96_07915 [Mycoplasmopsis cynos]|nr:hypothetical protein [Mycoplasmopsis cynos]
MEHYNRNFNITHTTTNNLLGSARISDVLVDNNTVSFSNSIANYSLNLGDDFDNVNQINYYDNNVISLFQLIFFLINRNMII